MIRREAGISHSGFYKYFQNISLLWHALSQDLVHSMELQSPTLVLSPNNKPIHSKQENIVRLANRSAKAAAAYTAAFLIQNETLVTCLALNGADPLFFDKWQRLAKAVYTERLRQHGFSATESRRLAEPLSHRFVSGCIEAVKTHDRQAIEDLCLVLEDILSMLCKYQVRSGSQKASEH